jgi:hypothetical protein
MAILDQGILGGIRKKIGNVVGARYKGTSYIRTRVIPKMSDSEGSELARDNMKAIMALGRFNNETVIKDGFGKAVKGKKLSPINRFVQRALKGIQPRDEYIKVPFSEGVVTPVKITAASYDKNTKVLTATVDKQNFGYASDTDICSIFISNIDDPTVEMLQSKSENKKRENVSATTGTGMYKILSSGKSGGAFQNQNFLHIVCFNAKGEASETASFPITMVDI